MKAYNLMKISFYSRSVNEGFARGALAAFLAQDVYKRQVPNQARYQLRYTPT